MEYKKLHILLTMKTIKALIIRLLEVQNKIKIKKKEKIKLYKLWNSNFLNKKLNKHKLIKKIHE